MPRRNQRKRNGQEGAHEHVAPSGFSWTLTYPERGSAIGQRKPLAIVEVDGHEPLHIPVPVARKLEASEEGEPESRAELLYRVRKAAEACAWQRVIDMASRREYSSKEATDKLRFDGYSSACAESVVAKAQEKRIINDSRFAESFVRMKLASGWGPVRLERELSQRGVELRDVPGWPDEFLGQDSVEDRARELLATKRIPEKNAYEKLVRFLATRGYPLSVAKSVVLDKLKQTDDDW